MRNFCLKNRKNRRALGLRSQTPLFPADGGFAPRPLASGGWELSLQTPYGLRRLEAPPPDPRNSHPP